MTENLLRWGNFLTFQEAFNFQLSVSYKSVVFKYVADKRKVLLEKVLLMEKHIPSQLNSKIFFYLNYVINKRPC